MFVNEVKCDSCNKIINTSHNREGDYFVIQSGKAYKEDAALYFPEMERFDLCAECYEIIFKQLKHLIQTKR